MKIPSDYLQGYEKARAVDPEMADNYIAHTNIGDPVMDAIVEELASVPQPQVHQFIQAGMDENREGLRNAPQLLRDFFIDAPQPEPDWLDYDVFDPGIRAFQRNSVQVLSAFVAGVLLDGFSTLISKSFVQTGRIFDNGVWRLKQNNRHQMEIFFPGGLRRYGDGWKLSVRIRFVHAQVRRLLGQTEEWEHDAWGVPISAAHLGYAVACFAARTVSTPNLWALVTARRSGPVSTMSGATPVILWASLNPSSSPTRVTPSTYIGLALYVSLHLHRTRLS